MRGGNDCRRREEKCEAEMTAEEDKKKCEVENAARERREEDEVQSPRQRHDLPQPMGGKTEYGKK